MRFLRPTLALLALPSAILAVSLSDFTPRVADDDLPKSCLAVYTQTINGCEGSDFGGTCSAGCMKALDSFASKVKTGCGSKDIPGGNIITTFLSGGGTAALCRNAGNAQGGDSDSTSAATTSAAATSKAATSNKASSSPETSISSSDSTSSTSTSSSSAALSGTATATSLASTTLALGAASSSGILVDTSTAPTATSTPTSSSNGNSQANMNDNSGGGSPFDSEGNMGSLAPLTTTCSFTAILLATGMVLFATLR